MYVRILITRKYKYIKQNKKELLKNIVIEHVKNTPLYT